MIGGFGLQLPGILAQAGASQGPGTALVVVLGSLEAGYSPDGNSWFPATFPSGPAAGWTPKDGCYGSAGFFIVATGGNFGLLSEDGVNWESFATPAGFAINGCAYSPTLDKYFACGHNPSSGLGAIWEFNPVTKVFTQRLSTDVNLQWIRWWRDTFITCGLNGTGRIKFSTDGLTWTNVTPNPPSGAQLRAVGRRLDGSAQESFMAVGPNTSTAYVSQTSDLQGTWLTRSLAAGLSNFPSDVLPIVDTARQLVGANDTRILRTDQDGASWSSTSLLNGSQNGRMSYSKALNRVFVPVAGSTRHYESTNQGQTFSIKTRGVVESSLVIVPRA